MRSHDYCHFEVVLGMDLLGLGEEDRIKAVDDMRKNAARLADKAVEQYMIAKCAAAKLETVKSEYALKLAEDTPEDQRTPEAKAIIKYHSDALFAARFDYDYEDDYDMWDNPNSPA